MNALKYILRAQSYKLPFVYHRKLSMEATNGFKSILYSKVGRVAHIALNRPTRLNAINMDVPRELQQAVSAANADDDVRVILLYGKGKAFCSGYDLKQFAEGERGSMPGSQTMPWCPYKDYSQIMHPCTEAFMSLWRSLKPVVCKVHGYAVAGGSDLALCADIVYMADDALIGYPPARLWGCPTTAMWVYRIGAEKAKRMLLTGDLIDGQEAARIGLVCKSVPAADLDSETDRLRQTTRRDEPDRSRMRTYNVEKKREVHSKKQTEAKERPIVSSVQETAVEDDAAKKRKTLLYLIGKNARKVYGTFTIVNAQNAAVAEADRTVEQIVAAFETYCNPKKNETVERYKFFTRSQNNGETFDEYITDLKTLAAECGFGEIRESLIRDRILIGILDGKVRERLLRESNLSLEKCAEICRAAEVSKQSIQTMEQVTVHVVKKKPQAPQASRTSVCKYCAKRHAANKEACPAYGKECASCGKRNHFARACRSGETKQPRSGRNQAQGRKKPLVHMLQEEAVMTVTEKRRRTACQVPDLGATCNVMPKHILDSNNIQYKTTGAQRVLTMYNNSQIVSEGETNLKMTNPKTGRRYVVNFVVIDSGSMPLLGSNAIQQIGVVTVHYDRILALSGSKPRLIQSTHSKALTKESLLEVYPDVFSGLGRLPGKCHLEVDESVKPVVHPPRTVPVAMKAQLQKELDKMTEDGVIEPVTVPTPWVSSLVTVLKPTGRLRICIDPRDLNTALKRSHYPAPTIEDILPELKKAKVFSVLDAKSGYWQVVLDEESSLLTTFNTPSGRYKWKRLPFGIKSSPEEFLEKT
ncbi:hypothetical protein Bbelb_392370 [Branchiostoma belcheri]|nr:hypothetical protein Bbelb_392370 [Branchiostoma belcheri]